MWRWWRKRSKWRRRRMVPLLWDKPWESNRKKAGERILKEVRIPNTISPWRQTFNFCHTQNFTLYDPILSLSPPSPSHALLGVEVGKWRRDLGSFWEINICLFVHSTHFDVHWVLIYIVIVLHTVWLVGKRFREIGILIVSGFIRNKK